MIQSHLTLRKRGELILPILNPEHHIGP